LPEINASFLARDQRLIWFSLFLASPKVANSSVCTSLTGGSSFVVRQPWPWKWLSKRVGKSLVTPAYKAPDRRLSMYIQAGIPVICIQRGVNFSDTTPKKSVSHLVRYEGSSPEPHRRRGRRASPTKKNRPTTVCGRVSRISTISFSRILGPSTPPRLPLDSWRPKAPLARGRSGRFGSPRHPAGAKDGERAPSPNKTPRHLLVTGRVEPLREQDSKRSVNPYLAFLKWIW